jgi:hypothetical protein
MAAPANNAEKSQGNRRCTTVLTRWNVVTTVYSRYAPVALQMQMPTLECVITSAPCLCTLVEWACTLVERLFSVKSLAVDPARAAVHGFQCVAVRTAPPAYLACLLPYIQLNTTLRGNGLLPSDAEAMSGRTIDVHSREYNRCATEWRY